MLFIQHRVNTAAQLERVRPEHGVEIDLRDRGDRLILQHDPFADGEDFDAWLAGYRHRLVILNVKSERIEPRVLELLRKHAVADYFFLDCSFPMTRWLVARGESNVAVRFSEYEPVESALALAGQVKWVWADCFSRMPFTEETYAKLRPHFKLCVVSPELQGRPVDTIPAFCHDLRPYPVDAVCTKAPEVWKKALEARGA